MYQRRTLGCAPLLSSLLSPLLWVCDDPTGECHGSTRSLLEETRHRTEAGLKIFTSHSSREISTASRNLQFGVPTWVVGTRKEVWSGRGKTERDKKKKMKRPLLVEGGGQPPTSERPVSERDDSHHVYVYFSEEGKSNRQRDARELNKGKNGKSQRYSPTGSHPPSLPLPLQCSLSRRAELFLGNFSSGSYQKSEREGWMKRSTTDF